MKLFKTIYFYYLVIIVVIDINNYNLDLLFLVLFSKNLEVIYGIICVLLIIFLEPKPYRANSHALTTSSRDIEHNPFVVILLLLVLLLFASNVVVKLQVYLGRRCSVPLNSSGKDTTYKQKQHNMRTDMFSWKLGIPSLTAR